MSDERNSIVSNLKMKSRSFQLVSGIDIEGVDTDIIVHFSFFSPNLNFKNEYRSMLFQAIKANLDTFFNSKNNYVRFCIQEKCLYHVFFIKNDDEKFIMILGPNNDHNGVQALHSNSFNLLTAEKTNHYLQLFQWIIEPYCEGGISQPVEYQITSSNEGIKFISDLSHVEVFYENESLHASIEEIQNLKSFILGGKISEIEKYFDYSSFSRYVLPELAKGDTLRSLKNHLIAACGIMCQISIDAGADNEYARTLADRYISLVETLHSQIDIFKLMKEMTIKFTECIIEFSNPNFSLISKKIIHYLNTNFYEKISLEDVAKKFNISPSHLSKKLKKETGLSFNENLNKIRIRESKKLLLETDKSIFEVAIAVGFNYQNHFGKIFKQMVGVSPNTFRNTRYVDKKLN